MNNKIKVEMEVPNELVNKARNVGLDLETHLLYQLKNSVNRLEPGPEGKDIDVSKDMSDKQKVDNENERGPDEFLSSFEDFCTIDQELAKSTTRERMRYARKLVKFLGKEHPSKATKDDLRNFVKQYDDHNAKKTVKVIYGRYLNTGLADSFKIPQPTIHPKDIPSKEKLQETYEELEDLEFKTAFLMLASSGLRRGELLSLTLEDVDLDKKELTPKRRSQTKNSWVTFYNREAEKKLQELLALKDIDKKIFTYHKDTYTKKIKDASNGEIRPKDLRDWFNEEMIESGTPELYVDALCGRTPSSVIRSSYSDYSPKKMKKRYEEANLTIFE